MSEEAFKILSEVRAARQNTPFNAVSDGEILDFISSINDFSAEPLFFALCDFVTNYEKGIKFKKSRTGSL